METPIKFLLTVAFCVVVWMLYDATSTPARVHRDAMKAAAAQCAAKISTEHEGMRLQQDARGRIVCSITHGNTLVSAYVWSTQHGFIRAGERNQ